MEDEDKQYKDKDKYSKIRTRYDIRHYFYHLVNILKIHVASV